MPTHYHDSTPIYIDTDAKFREWVQDVDAAILAAGCVLHSTTFDMTTVAKPTVADTFAGYRWYVFADALQAERPIRFGIEFGVGVGTVAPRARLFVGHMTAWPFGWDIINSNPGAANSRAIYASGRQEAGHNARIAIIVGALVTSPTSSYAWGFFIERTKDAGGNDTADGVIAGAFSGSSSSNTRIGVIGTQGVVDTAETTWPAVIPSGSMAYGGETGVFLVHPRLYKFLPPITGFLGYWNADIAVGSEFDTTLYGDPVHFVALGQNFNGASFKGGVSSLGAGMRWD